MAIQLHQPIVCPILVGRSAELTALQECIQQTASGQGGVVLLSGEAGIGKSRLVAELQRAAEALGFQLLDGQCFPTDRSCPYAPLLDLLRTFLAPLSSAQIVTALGSSARVLVPLLPEQVQHLPEIVSLPSVPSLDPEQEKRRLFAALAEVFIKQATSQPVLLLVEDIHWSDESTLEFLLFFARKTVASRLLVLLTYRSDEMHQPLRSLLAQLDRERLRQEVVLEPLSRADTETFLQTILQETDSLPVGMLDALYDLTEGNPFFLEEVLKALMMADELVEGEDGWRWKRADTWRIPLSLQDAVELRLTRLSADARRVVQLAAVAGRRFDFTLLQQITRYDEAHLMELMKEAMAAQLVIEESAEQFAFRHALTRQAIASGLLARERRALHGTIAQTLEQLHAAALDAYLADLAYHCTEAELWSQALEYAKLAAEQAQALYAPRAAVEQWTRVMHATQHLGQAVPPTCYRARGQASEILGDFEQAKADYERALQAARQVQAGLLEWQSTLDLAFLWTGRDYKRTGAYLQQAVDLARHLGDAGLQAHSLTRLATWLLNTDRSPRPFPPIVRRWRSLKRSRTSPGWSKPSICSGPSTTWQVTRSTPRSSMIGPSNYLRLAGNRSKLCSCLVMRAAVASPWSGYTSCTVNWSFAACERDLREALQLARELEWAAGEAFADIYFGGICASSGRLGAGLAYAQQGLRLATEINHQQWMCLARMMRWHASLCICWPPSRRLLMRRSGSEVARTLGSASWIAYLIAVQIQAYTALGQLRLAEAALHEVRSRAEHPAPGVGALPAAGLGGTGPGATTARTRPRAL